MELTCAHFNAVYIIKYNENWLLVFKNSVRSFSAGEKKKFWLPDLIDIILYSLFLNLGNLVEPPLVSLPMLIRSLTVTREKLK